MGTHGLRAFGDNRKKATVLVGRNPTLPGFPLQGPGISIEDFPHVKKKKKKTAIGQIKRYTTIKSIKDNNRQKII